MHTQEIKRDPLLPKRAQGRPHVCFQTRARGVDAGRAVTLRILASTRTSLPDFAAVMYVQFRSTETPPSDDTVKSATVVTTSTMVAAAGVMSTEKFYVRRTVGGRSKASPSPGAGRSRASDARKCRARARKCRNSPMQPPWSVPKRFSTSGVTGMMQEQNPGSVLMSLSRKSTQRGQISPIGCVECQSSLRRAMAPVHLAPQGEPQHFVSASLSLPQRTVLSPAPSRQNARLYCSFRGSELLFAVDYPVPRPFLVGTHFPTATRTDEIESGE